MKPHKNFRVTASLSVLTRYFSLDNCHNHRTSNLPNANCTSQTRNSRTPGHIQLRRFANFTPASCGGKLRML